jgi:hypothetical protein
LSCNISACKHPKRNKYKGSIKSKLGRSHKLYVALRYVLYQPAWNLHHHVMLALSCLIVRCLQVRVLRNVAFQHKQRAIREALAIGEQVARRRRRALLASTFMAWHVQVS